MRTEPIAAEAVAHARPPAKLNLFLELLARREDGFHEIDTVMVPIDWCDQMRVRRTEQARIGIKVQWLPSKRVIADRLGLQVDSLEAQRLLSIPDNKDNLVHRALQRFIETFGVAGGFDCDLAKSIPAGAGMGGASSDAAAALRCAAGLCGIPLGTSELWEMAAEIGSDVPFFLGHRGGGRNAAGRARGRGEVLQPISLGSRLYFVIAFPGVSLSTAKVYANSQVPPVPQHADQLIAALERGDHTSLESEMMNRLTQPAKKLAPQVGEILESLWRLGLRRCQLTGSGSACFAIVNSKSEARRCAAHARAALEPGAIVMATRSTYVPAMVDMT